MLFTWDTTNLCIVFPSWRVTGTLSLIVSLLAVVALTAGYEAIREVSRRYEERQDAKVREAPRKFSFLFCYLLAPPVPWNSSGSGIVHEEVCLSVCLSIRWSKTHFQSFLLTHYSFPRQQRRRRTKLTPCGRQCRRGGREKGQDGQGRAVRRAGILFVLHHVSFAYLPCTACGNPR